MNPHVNVGTMGRGLDGFAAKAIAALPAYIASGGMGLRAPMAFEPQPAEAPGPQPLSPAALERMQAAVDKRRRKLERYTNTPQARARRLEMEAEHAAGVPRAYPEPVAEDA